MSINLSKGQNINLSKDNPGLKKVLVGLQWDPRTTDGEDFDLDASAFICGPGPKVMKDSNFVFFNNTQNKNNSVKHFGDNKNGRGDGDDEIIVIDLVTLPAENNRVVFSVTIHDAQNRGQSFGQVPASAIRICDGEKIDAYKSQNPSATMIDIERLKIGEIARFDLQEDYSTETAMVMGELYSHNGDWKFRAIGSGFTSGLQGLLNDYVDPNSEQDVAGLRS
ncbi:TerD family protein [Rhizobium sp. MHM7A]|nr:TerD family protein [Rhizobium sp. MHM7A]